MPGEGRAVGRAGDVEAEDVVGRALTAQTEHVAGAFGEVPEE
jgi:hypothetical protein